MDGFLKNTPGARKPRDISRRLLLWRTGVLPGKPQKCQKCDGRSQATRDHLVESSGLKEDIETYIQPGLQGEHNILDAALNDAKIRRIPEVWTKVKKGHQTVWSKSLGGKWHSSHKGSPGAEQKVST